MATVDFAELLGPALGAAIQEKGFTDLTTVQKAVLDPALKGRDLRVTSQTGSGKTLAIGFSIRDLAAEPTITKDRLAHPRALVIVPTRELAKQVVQELTWLFAGLDIKVAGVTGGAVYRDEHRALAAGPSVVVGTPGRMLDHLNRGSIVPDTVAAVVLDEADRMLDLGFREELEAIVGSTPKERQTHLVSATFPRDVEALANRFQRDPARVEGTRLGVANVDIDHVMHVLEPRQRLDAVINLLLASPDAQTIIFARTRADVGDVTERLSEAGFAVNALSGEMDQRERDRALTSFRRADHRVLVATDVAARGIDVQDITLVIHLDPPTDPDSYTHRSGRTGRAGRKGRSVLLVAPSAVNRTTQLLRRVKISPRTEPVPSAASIRASMDQRFFDLITKDDEADATAAPEKQLALAERLAKREDVVRSISRLLAMARFAGPTEPRELKRVERGTDRKLSPRDRDVPERAPRGGDRDTRDHEPRAPQRDRSPRGRDDGDWVTFRVTWGGHQGADVRKLLAMACRWGNIRGSDVGAIDIEGDYSRINVKAAVARGFAEATSEPDSRNPRVTITPDNSRRGLTPHTVPPPPPEAESESASDAEEESVPRQPERSVPKKAPFVPAARSASPSSPRHASPSAPRHAPPSRGAGPREASRPRAVKGYAKNGKSEAARPQFTSRPRPAAAAPATPPRSGGEPPRRRRVVTR